MALRVVSPADSEPLADEQELADLMRDAMVANRRLEAALYERYRGGEAIRATTGLMRALTLVAAAIEHRLAREKS